MPDVPSNGLRTALAGADADAVFQRQNKDLAVADAALGSGSACVHNRVHGRLDEVFIARNLELNLAKQVYRQLVAAIDLGESFLPAKALNVPAGPAEHFDLIKCFPYR